MPDTDVLIAGAGPTGLVLALWLQRLGVRVRVIDKASQPGTTSRALVLHARTLELYQQIGIAEAIVGQGLEFAAINLWVRGTKAARVAFGDIGAGLSPYPYMLIYPQDQHERFLIERLEEKGVQIDRPTEVVGFSVRRPKAPQNAFAERSRRNRRGDETAKRPRVCYGYVFHGP
jgi:2-polyprenyl-6-methoxyphenol hydroxylase-like FAD-dependent oxidoreductase